MKEYLKGNSNKEDKMIVPDKYQPLYFSNAWFRATVDRLFPLLLEMMALYAVKNQEDLDKNC